MSELRQSPSDWRMRVLVVEDHRDQAHTLARLLEQSGHEVSIAFDGHSAVEQARTNQPDVALLDIGLPGIDGWEVARMLHEMAIEKRPLLVAITGNDSEEDRRLSEEVGIDLHLNKPVTTDDLICLLDRFRGIIAQPV